MTLLRPWIFRNKSMTDYEDVKLCQNEDDSKLGYATISDDGNSEWSSMSCMKQEKQECEAATPEYFPDDQQSTISICGENTGNVGTEEEKFAASMDSEIDNEQTKKEHSVTDRNEASQSDLHNITTAEIYIEGEKSDESICKGVAEEVCTTQEVWPEATKLSCTGSNLSHLDNMHNTVHETDCESFTAEKEQNESTLPNEEQSENSLQGEPSTVRGSSVEDDKADVREVNQMNAEDSQLTSIAFVSEEKAESVRDKRIDMGSTEEIEELQVTAPGSATLQTRNIDLRVGEIPDSFAEEIVGDNHVFPHDETSIEENLVKPPSTQEGKKVDDTYAPLEATEKALKKQSPIYELREQTQVIDDSPGKAQSNVDFENEAVKEWVSPCDPQMPWDKQEPHEDSAVNHENGTLTSEEKEADNTKPDNGGPNNFSEALSEPCQDIREEANRNKERCINLSTRGENMSENIAVEELRSSTTLETEGIEDFPKHTTGEDGAFADTLLEPARMEATKKSCLMDVVAETKSTDILESDEELQSFQIKSEEKESMPDFKPYEFHVENVVQQSVTSAERSASDFDIMAYKAPGEPSDKGKELKNKEPDRGFEGENKTSNEPCSSDETTCQTKVLGSIFKTEIGYCSDKSDVSVSIEKDKMAHIHNIRNSNIVTGAVYEREKSCDTEAAENMSNMMHENGSKIETFSSATPSDKTSDEVLETFLILPEMAAGDNISDKAGLIADSGQDIPLQHVDQSKTLNDDGEGACMALGYASTSQEEVKVMHTPNVLSENISDTDNDKIQNDREDSVPCDDGYDLVKQFDLVKPETVGEQPDHEEQDRDNAFHAEELGSRGETLDTTTRPDSIILSHVEVHVEGCSGEAMAGPGNCKLQDMEANCARNLRSPKEKPQPIDAIPSLANSTNSAAASESTVTAAEAMEYENEVASRSVEVPSAKFTDHFRDEKNNVNQALCITSFATETESKDTLSMIKHLDQGVQELAFNEAEEDFQNVLRGDTPHYEKTGDPIAVSPQQHEENNPCKFSDCEPSRGEDEECGSDLPCAYHGYNSEEPDNLIIEERSNINIEEDTETVEVSLSHEKCTNHVHAIEAVSTRENKTETLDVGFSDGACDGAPVEQDMNPPDLAVKRKISLENTYNEATGNSAMHYDASCTEKLIDTGSSTIRCSSAEGSDICFSESPTEKPREENLEELQINDELPQMDRGSNEEECQEICTTDSTNLEGKSMDADIDQQETDRTTSMSEKIQEGQRTLASHMFDEIDQTYQGNDELLKQEFEEDKPSTKLPSQQPMMAIEVSEKKVGDEMDTQSQDSGAELVNNETQALEIREATGFKTEHHAEHLPETNEVAQSDNSLCFRENIQDDSPQNLQSLTNSEVFCENYKTEAKNYECSDSNNIVDDSNGSYPEEFPVGHDKQAAEVSSSDDKCSNDDHIQPTEVAATREQENETSEGGVSSDAYRNDPAEQDIRPADDDGVMKSKSSLSSTYSEAMGSDSMHREGSFNGNPIENESTATKSLDICLSESSKSKPGEDDQLSFSSKEELLINEDLQQTKRMLNEEVIKGVIANGTNLDDKTGDVNLVKSTDPQRENESGTIMSDDVKFQEVQRTRESCKCDEMDQTDPGTDKEPGNQGFETNELTNEIQSQKTTEATEESVENKEAQVDIPSQVKWTELVDNSIQPVEVSEAAGNEVRHHIQHNENSVSVRENIQDDFVQELRSSTDSDVFYDSTISSSSVNDGNDGCENVVECTNETHGEELQVGNDANLDLKMTDVEINTPDRDQMTEDLVLRDFTQASGKESAKEDSLQDVLVGRTYDDLSKTEIFPSSIMYFTATDIATNMDNFQNINVEVMPATESSETVTDNVEGKEEVKSDEQIGTDEKDALSAKVTDRLTAIPRRKENDPMDEIVDEEINNVCVQDKSENIITSKDEDNSKCCEPVQVDIVQEEAVFVKSQDNPVAEDMHIINEAVDPEEETDLEAPVEKQNSCSDLVEARVIENPENETTSVDVEDLGANCADMLIANNNSYILSNENDLIICTSSQMDRSDASGDEEIASQEIEGASTRESTLHIQTYAEVQTSAEYTAFDTSIPTQNESAEMPGETKFFEETHVAEEAERYKEKCDVAEDVIREEKEKYANAPSSRNEMNMNNADSKDEGTDELVAEQISEECSPSGIWQTSNNVLAPEFDSQENTMAAEETTKVYFSKQEVSVVNGQEETSLQEIHPLVNVKNILNVCSAPENGLAGGSKELISMPLDHQLAAGGDEILGKSESFQGTENVPLTNNSVVEFMEEQGMKDAEKESSAVNVSVSGAHCNNIQDFTADETAQMQAKQTVETQETDTASTMADQAESTVTQLFLTEEKQENCSSEKIIDRQCLSEQTEQGHQSSGHWQSKPALEEISNVDESLDPDERESLSEVQSDNRALDRIVVRSQSSRDICSQEIQNEGDQLQQKSEQTIYVSLQQDSVSKHISEDYEQACLTLTNDPGRTESSMPVTMLYVLEQTVADPKGDFNKDRCHQTVESELIKEDTQKDYYESREASMFYSTEEVVPPVPVKTIECSTEIVVSGEESRSVKKVREENEERNAEDNSSEPKFAENLLNDAESKIRTLSSTDSKTNLQMHSIDVENVSEELNINAQSKFDIENAKNFLQHATSEERTDYEKVVSHFPVEILHVSSDLMAIKDDSSMFNVEFGGENEEEIVKAESLQCNEPETGENRIDNTQREENILRNTDGEPLVHDTEQVTRDASIWNDPKTLEGEHVDEIREVAKERNIEAEGHGQKSGKNICADVHGDEMIVKNTALYKGSDTNVQGFGIDDESECLEGDVKEIIQQARSEEKTDYEVDASLLPTERTASVPNEVQNQQSAPSAKALYICMNVETAQGNDKKGLTSSTANTMTEETISNPEVREDVSTTTMHACPSEENLNFGDIEKRTNFPNVATDSMSHDVKGITAPEIIASHTIQEIETDEQLELSEKQKQVYETADDKALKNHVCQEEQAYHASMSLENSTGLTGLPEIGQREIEVPKMESETMKVSTQKHELEESLHSISDPLRSNLEEMPVQKQLSPEFLGRCSRLGYKTIGGIGTYPHSELRTTLVSVENPGSSCDVSLNTFRMAENFERVPELHSEGLAMSEDFGQDMHGKTVNSEVVVERTDLKFGTSEATTGATRKEASSDELVKVQHSLPITKSFNEQEKALMVDEHCTSAAIMLSLVAGTTGTEASEPQPLGDKLLEESSEKACKTETKKDEGAPIVAPRKLVSTAQEEGMTEDDIHPAFDSEQKSKAETLPNIGHKTEEGHHAINKQETLDVEEPTAQEPKSEEKEEECDADSVLSAPLMSESLREIEVKAQHKKSHNLFSGMGSKMKQSILKVKKAIACTSPQFPEDVIVKANKSKRIDQSCL